MKQRAFSHKSGAVLGLVMLLICSIAQGQTYTNLPNYGFRWNRGIFTNTLRIPSGPTPVFNSTGDSTGAIFYNTTDSSIYVHTGSQWIQLGSGGGGTYSAGYGIILNSGAFRVDTTLISTRLWRQKGIDSINAYISSNYYTKTNINAFFGGTSIISGYNKTNWDAVHAAWAAAMALSPAGWATQSALVDTADAIRGSITAIPGVGDMEKSTYDTDNDGVVDNAELFNGVLPSYYFARANHTGTQPFSSITGTVPINQGGTNATTASGARTNLGLSTGWGLTGFYAVDSVLVASRARLNHTRDSLLGLINAIGTPTLQQTLTASNLMTGNIQSNSTAYIKFGDVAGTYSGSYMELGGNVGYARLITRGGKDYYFSGYGIEIEGGWSGGTVSTALRWNNLTQNRQWQLPDSTGTIPIAIYANGTRYNANTQGTIDLGTISGGGSGSWNGLFSNTTSIGGSSATLGTNNYYHFTGTTATWTLPDRATNAGRAIFLKNAGSGNLTIQRAGSDQIWTNAAVNSFVLAAGESATMISTGGYWNANTGGGLGSSATADMISDSLTAAGVRDSFYVDEDYFSGAGTSGSPLTFIGSTGTAPSTTSSTSTSLTLTVTGSYIKTYSFTGSSAATWTLPAIGTTGQIMKIKNRGTANVVVQRAGSNQIYTTTAINSITMYPGDQLELQDDGTYWIYND